MDSQPNGKRTGDHVTAALPAGWTAQSGIGNFSGGEQWPAARLEVNLPGWRKNGPKKLEAQEVTVRGRIERQSIGEVN